MDFLFSYACISWELAKHISFLSRKLFGQSRTFLCWRRTFLIRGGLFSIGGGLFSIGGGLFLIGVGLFLSPTVTEKKSSSNGKKSYCNPKKVLDFGIFRWTWVLKSIYGAVNFGCWRSTKGEWERDECSTSALLYLRLLMSDGGVTYQGRYAVNVGPVQPSTASTITQSVT